jgi:hypothetical protein
MNMHAAAAAAAAAAAVAAYMRASVAVCMIDTVYQLFTRRRKPGRENQNFA